jgi:hypothetical protein
MSGENAMPKINIRIVIALVIMVAIVFFAYNSVQSESYSGNELTFNTSGVITLVNNASDPATVRATSPRTFTVTTTDTENRTMRATREGTGRTAIYAAEGTIAPGTTELKVTRGGGVDFNIQAAGGALSATVAARDASGNRSIVITALVGCLIILGYISFETQHIWLKSARRMVVQRVRGSKGGVSPSTA